MTTEAANSTNKPNGYGALKSKGSEESQETQPKEHVSSYLFLIIKQLLK